MALSVLASALVAKADSGDELSDAIKIRVIHPQYISFQIVDLEKLKDLSVRDTAISGGVVRTVQKFDGAYSFPNEPFCFLAPGSSNWSAFKKGLVLPVTALNADNKVGDRFYINFTFEGGLVLTCGRSVFNYFSVKDVRDVLKGVLKVSVITK